MLLLLHLFFVGRVFPYFRSLLLLKSLYFQFSHTLANT